MSNASAKFGQLGHRSLSLRLRIEQQGLRDLRLSHQPEFAAISCVQASSLPQIPPQIRVGRISLEPAIK
jgi:hypothetical protein